MPYKIAHTPEDAKSQIDTLVSSFKSDYRGHKDPKYNETQLRNDFLNPLLLSLGWDVFNDDSKNQYLRPVLQEESIDVEGSKAKKSPDYTLRTSGIRQFFLEAKKPSISIENSSESAFQTRRYGWNASLNISILSNFEYLIIFDCRHKPDEAHNENVARYRIFHYEEYINNFDEIYNLLSFTSVNSGSLTSLFEKSAPVLESFDHHFLKQIQNWRYEISNSIFKTNKTPLDDLTLITQKIINRIIFLRICEDRNIEKYETLKSITTYSELKDYFLYADKRYNSGLFELIEDNFTTKIILDDELIISIFQELYYPFSPYDFSIVDSTILSQIYENFLGDRLSISNDHIEIIEEPEVSASKGVIPTPVIITSKITRLSLESLTNNVSLEELTKLKVADICCGSGTFLLQAYDFLINKTLETLIKEKQTDSDDIIKLNNEEYKLSLSGKIKVLLNNIFGVDVNPYAVEVASFGLLVKTLENETSDSVEHYLKNSGSKVLPVLSNNIKTGNSLIDNSYFEFAPDAIKDLDLISKIAPFHWPEEYPDVFEQGGFDAIIGNPPYVRIQNLIKHTPEEIRFFKSKKYGYKVAENNSIDKYYIFIERALSLTNESGSICYIVPHKFTILLGGKKLRSIITTSSNIEEIIHFGTSQVFKDHSTYTAIIHLTKTEKENINFKRISEISPQILDDHNNYLQFTQSSFNADPWVFLSSDTSAIFDIMFAKSNSSLKSVSNIVVGVQTSLDNIYIFEPHTEDCDYFYFTSKINDQEERIEKTICKPCIYDLSFSSYDSIEPNSYMIFPYYIDENKAILFDENELNAQFPNAFAYLEKHKTILSKRSINGKNPTWYQFGRSQSLTKFEDSEKLIWPVLATSASYTLDNKNILFTGGGNGPYYALTKKAKLSLKYILSILSHPVIESMVKSGASEFRGDYYSHGKLFIENLPIIIPSNDNEKVLYESIISLTDSILLMKHNFPALPHLQRKPALKQIDLTNQQIVSEINKLYGITDKDIDVVLMDEAYN